MFFVERPMEDAMGTVDVIATLDHGHVFKLNVTKADGTGEFACFGDFRWGTGAGMRARGVSGGVFIVRVVGVRISVASSLFILLH